MRKKIHRTAGMSLLLPASWHTASAFRIDPPSERPVAHGDDSVRFNFDRGRVSSRIGLNYAEFFGDYGTDADGVAAVPNGATAHSATADSVR